MTTPATPRRTKALKGASLIALLAVSIAGGYAAGYHRGTLPPEKLGIAAVVKLPVQDPRFQELVLRNRVSELEDAVADIRSSTDDLTSSTADLSNEVDRFSNGYDNWQDVVGDVQTVTVTVVENAEAVDTAVSNAE